MALCFNSLTCVSKLHLEDFALRSVSRQHCRNRAQQNLEIERQAPAFHVFEIQLHARFKRRIGARDDLPEPGYAWFHIQPAVIGGPVARAIVHGMGAWTYQAHIPFQDIPELGQFVEAVLAKKAAEPRNARIIGDFEERVPAFVESAQRIFQFVGAVDHGPEFIANKSLSLFSRAERTIDDRARRFELDGDGNHEQERPEKQKSDAGQCNVYDPLHERAANVDSALTWEGVASSNCAFASTVPVSLGQNKVQNLSWGRHGRRTCR